MKLPVARLTRHFQMAFIEASFFNEEPIARPYGSHQSILLLKYPPQDGSVATKEMQKQ